MGGDLGPVALGLKQIDQFATGGGVTRITRRCGDEFIDFLIVLLGMCPVVIGRGFQAAAALGAEGFLIGAVLPARGTDLHTQTPQQNGLLNRLQLFSCECPIFLPLYDSWHWVYLHTTFLWVMGFLFDARNDVATLLLVLACHPGLG